MGLRKNKAPPRKPHPDPLIELQLQRILGCLQAIGRYELLIGEYRDQMSSASEEQNEAGYALRNYGSYGTNEYSHAMEASEQRISAARQGITEAEQAIAARREETAKLAAEMSETDLAYL